MNKLLKVCEKFQQDWNIKFNLKKSFSLNKKTETDVKTIEKIFILNNSRLNDVNQIIYLWLPIGQREFIRKFWTETYKPTEAQTVFKAWTFNAGFITAKTLWF